MTATRMAVQSARIPALLVLLWATAPPVEVLNRPILQLRQVWGPWALVSAVSVAFVVVMLVGRRQRHPWVVLVIEAAVAAAVALVPPVYWVIWGGIDSWSTAMTGGFAQPLAMAWLGVVGLRALDQVRDARETADPEGNGDGSSAQVPRTIGLD